MNSQALSTVLLSPRAILPFGFSTHATTNEPDQTKLRYLPRLVCVYMRVCVCVCVCVGLEQRRRRMMTGLPRYSPGHHTNSDVVRIRDVIEEIPRVSTSVYGNVWRCDKYAFQSI
jgi:hypothetical protein